MRVDGRRALEQAVREMRECKEVFASWRRSLDYSGSTRPSDLEIQIRSYIAGLEDSSLAALNESENIMRAHASLGIIMSKRLSDGKSADGKVALRASPEVISLIQEIQNRSGNVSNHAGRMKDQLRGLVEILERSEPKKKKTLGQSFFGWLKKIFHVVSGVLSALAAASLAVFHIGAPVLAAGSALASAAASIVSDYENGSATSFEKLLAMLRETIPAQAGRIAGRLSDFQYCNSLLQNELEMQKGAIYLLDRQEAENASLQWDIHNAGMQLIRV